MLAQKVSVRATLRPMELRLTTPSRECNEGFSGGILVKRTIKRFIEMVFGILPLRDRIIFESHPDLACNTYPVFRYLLDRGLNKKYEMIWLVNDETRYKECKDENVSYVNIEPQDIFERLRLMYLLSTAKALVYSNRILGKKNSRQISIFLSHGSVIKKLKGYYEVEDKCDFMLNQSEFFSRINSEQLCVSPNKLVCLGFPRNDYLFRQRDVLTRILDTNIRHKKMIVWLPTYRKHKNVVGPVDEVNSKNNGIPFLDSHANIDKLNRYLNQYGLLLVIKPHPVQDVSCWKNELASNIVFVNDEILSENQIQLYELLSQSDALISDYSSVYFDYLLTDRPIGLVIQDLNQYQNTRGFALENPLEILKGEYISSLNDLLTFLENVRLGIDRCGPERDRIKHLTNYHQDDRSTERVSEFLVEQLNRA